MTVSLYNNELAEVPAALCGLPALRKLDLGMNHIASLAGIERCRSLVELSLPNNRLERLPDGIGELAALRSLNLCDNPLGELPDSLCGLASLEALYLVACPIARFPADIARLTKLVQLDVTGTLLDAQEHARIRAALPNAKIVGTPATNSKPYSIKSTYAVGDTIAHLKFGAGTVCAVFGDDRIQVAFHEGVKTLAHRRR